MDPALEYLGSLEFVLYGVADAEQHLFAEIEGDRVRRLLWVQFEGYLDEGRGRLYVLTRFDNSISVIDTATHTEVAHMPMYNPERRQKIANLLGDIPDFTFE